IHQLLREGISWLSSRACWCCALRSRRCWLLATAHARKSSPPLRLRSSARADDAQNAVAVDCNGPVNDAAFVQLQEALPDWVEMAYAGYDNAVIRAKRPVTFMTKAESDGFSMRMVPRDAAAPAPVQTASAAGGPCACWHGCPPA